MAIRPEPLLDVRKLIVQTTSTQGAHDRQHRPAPQDIETLYDVDVAFTSPPRDHIFVADDVLTTGTHFRAAKSLLTRQFPGTPVTGIFVARHV